MPDKNFLEMSDDDFAKLGEPDFASPPEDEQPEQVTEDVVEEDHVEDVVSEDLEPAPAEEPDTETEEPAEDIPAEEDPEPADPKPEDTPGDTEEQSTQEAIDYKAAYEKMMAPFKANGREITPKNLEDLRRLQEMGANYHHKMAGMKPARKTLKLLQNHDLLDEDKLNFLIDVSKGNPEAINKLLQEHKIDPLGVDTETESTYKPNTYTVSDAEIALDTVLKSIEDTPHYTKTLNVVTREWDENSRTVAARDPHIISVINGHIGDGTYDKVMNAVQYERSLGRLEGISDFEAYKSMGQTLESMGMLGETKATQPAEATVTQTPKPKVDPVKEAERVRQKKAASPTNQTKKPIGKLPEGFNPLNLSDEEFAKLDPKLLGL